MLIASRSLIFSIEFIYYLKTLFELKKKFSSPAMVECSLPAAQPLFITRAPTRAGSPATRLPSTCFSYSGRPPAFLSCLLFLSSSLSFLSQLSTVLCKSNFHFGGTQCKRIYILEIEKLSTS